MNLDYEDRKKDNLSLSKNPYKKSAIHKKLLTQLRKGNSAKIAFLDIDTTLTGDLAAIKKTRERLEELGYALVFVTSRTEEMVMSKKEYKKSFKLGFSRPKPNIKRARNGKYTYKDPAAIDPLLVDPDIIIGSTGTQIIVRQENGGYIPDNTFTTQFALDSISWREKVFKTISLIDPYFSLAHIAPIEFVENYDSKKTDVYPPFYRIKVVFNSMKAKATFLLLLKTITPFITTKHIKGSKSWLRVIDDSNPKKNKYSIFFTPNAGYKGNAVNHVVESICLTSKRIIKNKIEVILAGDSYPDVAMLFYGAQETNATAILVGGSRLSKIFVDRTVDSYCGEDISYIKQQLCILTNKVGHYQFNENKNSISLRSIIIGDKAYPQTKGAQTILAYLNREEAI